MKNLGEKLLEARNGLGLSIRDAAEATRLRADVIESMESGKFDYPLPEIYKRGFLRIYAAFLKLDVAESMAEYADLSKPSGDSKKGRGLLSRMSANQPREVEPEQTPEPAQNDLESRFEESPVKAASNDEDTMRYVKLGAIFVGLVLAVVVLVLIITSAVRTNAPELNPDVNASLPTQPADASAAVQGVSHKEIVLAITGVGDTYLLAYPENNPQKPFFSGPIQAGERKEFKSESPIMVKLTDAERVKMERNSKPLDLGAAKGMRLFRVGFGK